MLPKLDTQLAKKRIARRVALQFEDGDTVNLGIGIPTFVSDYIPEDVRIIFQAENGAIGVGPPPEVPDLKYIGAGGRAITLLPGGSFFSSETSFGLIRGGHIDATVLGALEVAQNGDIASWMIPGQDIHGMGGAMDLLVGARRVYTAMRHVTDAGTPKLLKKCTLPLTAAEAVDMVFTEFAVFGICSGRMTLLELAPDVTLEQIREHTEAEFSVSENLTVMRGAI